MAGTIKHIVKRKGVYQYHRRVPQEIVNTPSLLDAYFGGKAQFRRSLRTKDQGEALYAAHEIDREFELRVAGALGRGPAPRPLRPLTGTLLHRIRDQQRDSIIRPFRNHLVHREQDEAHDEEVKRMYEEFEQDAERISRVLIDLEPTTDPRLQVSEVADSIIDREGIEAPSGSSARSLVCTAVREGMLEGYREIGSLMNGSRSVLPTAASRPRARLPTLSQAVANYLPNVSGGRSKVEVGTALRDFINLIGDRPLDEISKADVLHFCEHEGAKTIGGGSRNSIKRPMSSATLKKKVGLLRAAFNRAIKRGTFDGANPFAGIDVSVFTTPQPAALMPEKRPFEFEELQSIFAYPWFTGCASATNIHKPGSHRLAGVHYWAPVVALFTGCRAGELGGLMLEEVRIDTKFPHLVIRDNKFRTTKKHYQRKVPLLDQLMEAGFADFVSKAAARGQTRLFEDWKAPATHADAEHPAWSNGSMVRSFNQTLIPKALASHLRPGARREVTFHSFRGAFKRLLTLQRYNIQTNYVHEVVGHEKFHLDARYIGEIPLEETYQAVRGCRYDGLELPPAPA